MLTIIDYGIGNLRSIEKAFQSAGVEVLRTDDPALIAEARHLVLPGVGAFGACADEIRKRDLEQPILDYVATGRPFLGVCVGMQLLFDVGEERGEHAGLGILPGRVVHFHHATNAGAAATLKVPHMGWNTVEPQRKSPLLKDLGTSPYFYFVHSYHALPENATDVLGRTAYGATFPAIVQRNNVFGVQFHPEKSQKDGLQILKNFCEIPSS